MKEHGKITLKMGEFEKNSIIVFTLSMISNVLGLVFQSLSGHILDNPAMFADLNAVISLMGILSLPNSVLVCFIAKYTSELSVSYGKVKTFLTKMAELVILLAAIYSLALIILRTWLLQLLNINDMSSILLIIVLSGLSMFGVIFSGELQGLQMFAVLGLYGVIGQLIKIATLMAVKHSDEKINGMLILWVFCTFVQITCFLVYIRKLFRKYNAEDIKIKGEADYIFKLIWANIGILVTSNLDILLIKRNYNNYAGNFAAALTLGKMVSYFTSAFVTVIFPMAARANASLNEKLNLIKKSIIYTLIIGGTFVIIINLGAESFIRIILGESYLGCKQYLFPISFYSLAFSVLNLISNFNMARNNMNFVTLTLILGCLCEMFATWIVKDNIFMLINIFLIVMWLLVLINLCDLFIRDRVAINNE